MEKNFDKWNKQKKNLDSHRKRPSFQVGEVWWSSLGLNIGFEQDGKGSKYSRPVLILKKFNGQVVWVIPLSTVIKENKFYAPIVLGDKIERAGIISQLRLIDTKRLEEKLGNTTKENFEEIQKAVANLITEPPLFANFLPSEEGLG